VITHIRLLRNIGQFHSVDAGAVIPLARFLVVYAENGRGKTTLAAILRSLASGDRIPIVERRRLASEHPPHVVLECSGTPPQAVFRDDTWNRTLPDIVIFDDHFVDENVYSGLTVSAEHRQNLHELVLGAQGVTLNRQLQDLVGRIERHNSDLRVRASAIPVTARRAFSVDDFCALPLHEHIDDEIQIAERNLAAARQQVAVRQTTTFDLFRLPAFDLGLVSEILDRDLPALDAAAVRRVHDHLANLGEDGEEWAARGMEFVSSDAGSSNCPFCAQSLAGSSLIDHYRAYFSAEYAEANRAVSEFIALMSRLHGGNAQAAFERGVRLAGDLRRFWSGFCDVPEVALDTASITRDWQAARDGIGLALRAKQLAPLERSLLSSETLAATQRFNAHVGSLENLNERLHAANDAIRAVKAQAATASAATIEAQVMRLRPIKVRHAQPVAGLCQAYEQEIAAKSVTEGLRDEAQAALESYRQTAFPAFQNHINTYLGRFNAGFRVGRVAAADTRGGPACNYDVLINDVHVDVAAGAVPAGSPTFRNTLSSGDRNTLALAFFFASLDQDQRLAEKVIVIDDPISSLDEHRSLTTVQELRRLGLRVSQLIVLSHSKPFLCRICEGIARTDGSAVQIVRDVHGSTLVIWDVDQEALTDHDRRHALLRSFLDQGPDVNSREVATALRPVIEAYLRVAFPAHCPPSRHVLGRFLTDCEHTVGTIDEILGISELQELQNLAEYAHRFHHDTNTAWETAAINDGELRAFAERLLTFTSK
jgi:wobble nucleotide-excising tRNase